uniref:Methyltransferase type 11 domain-containing protein n=1 Tax=Alexandrium monilatum TaxID=311494 RepID=A0A7S4W2H4_9DINO
MGPQGRARAAGLLPGTVLLLVAAQLAPRFVWLGPALPRCTQTSHAVASCSRTRVGAWGPGSYMLFDTGGFQREEFILNTISKWLEGVPKGVMGLEWQPESQKVVKQVYGLGLAFLARYIVAGNGFDQQFLDNFGMIGPFDKVEVDFLDWQRGDALRLADSTIDVVICTSEAAENLGPDGLDEVVRESARVLKPGGRLLLFQRPEYEPPPSAAELFDQRDTAFLPGDSEMSLDASLLIPRKVQTTQVVRRVRRRRRRKPVEGSE